MTRLREGWMRRREQGGGSRQPARARRQLPIERDNDRGFFANPFSEPCRLTNNSSDESAGLRIHESATRARVQLLSPRGNLKGGSGVCSLRSRTPARHPRWGRSEFFEPVDIALVEADPAILHVTHRGDY